MIDTTASDDRVYAVEIVRLALYDIGRAIDLKQAADLLPGVPGMRIQRRRDTPTSLTMPVPLCVDLRSGLKRIYSEESIEGFAASARLYDEGVMSIVVRLNVNATLEGLHGIEAKPITNTISDIDSYIDERYRAVLEQVLPAVRSPRHEPESETYLAYCFADVGVDPTRFLSENERDLTTLIAGEPWGYPLHESQIQKTMSNPFSYSGKDLAVFDMDRCIIVDSDRDYEDVLLICELANYQYLELRSLDKLLDRWLDEAEDDVNAISLKGQGKKLKTGALRKKFGKIQALRLDALFILENLENSAKIIGDYFLGTVYEHICGIFNTSGWTRSVERRLDALQNIYEIVKVERSERTMLILDVVFIIVCIILPVLQILQVMLSS
ncbi:MAG: hypothetical protein CVV47_07955 [Spirochaetae bacterium HGW-Spirochaetae-3]|jgi:hypothetical protein|nr:MAG: hypothetical protein CVV47_07955 [Spirochaetae bacterium HGW-Spirochaetae-3]